MDRPERQRGDPFRKGVFAVAGIDHPEILEAETPTFIRQARKLFSEQERRELIDYLAANPLAGDEIPGAGGVRKLRFAASGRGKRGGARVIYFYGGDRIPIYLLLVYAKSDRIDLNPGERRAVAAIVRAIKGEERERR